MARPKKEKVYSLDELQSLFQKEYKENRKILQSIRKQVDNQNKRSQKTLESCFQALQKICKINEEVEATLCSVKLAIRQNEYLQAWYPDHDTSGDEPVHPKIMERIEKKYAVNHSE